MSSRRFRIGTRTSALARAQTDVVIQLVRHALPGLDESALCVVPIQASGDWRPGTGERMLADQGGNKGLFVKELEEALLHGEIDIAVHSMKDMPTILPEGLTLAAMPKRGAVGDVLVTPDGGSAIASLPAGAVIGTSSLRRRAQILAQRSDIRVEPLRGNVDTRLRKLHERQVHATILARAGLDRLAMPTRIGFDLSFDVMLPAAGQGALGIEIRAADQESHELVCSVACPVTMACVDAERAALDVLDGSCHTPIAALAQDLGDGMMRLEALVAHPDGQWIRRFAQEGSHADARGLGLAVGQKLKA